MLLWCLVVGHFPHYAATEFQRRYAFGLTDGELSEWSK